MSHVVEILFCGRQGLSFIVNTKATDDLAVQLTLASEALVFLESPSYSTGRVISVTVIVIVNFQFSVTNSVLAGMPLANVLGENMQFYLQNMFTLRPFNSAILLYFTSKFAHMHLCGIHYQSLWPNCCKTSSAWDIEAINCDNACMTHLFIVTTQAWWDDSKQPEHHPLAQTKYDTFVMFVYCWEYILASDILKNILWNCPHVNAAGKFGWQVNIESVNGMVPDGTKQLSEPMLTKLSSSIWCHQGTMG